VAPGPKTSGVAVAGDWIKWVNGLNRRRETLVIAERLGLDHWSVASRLMEVWEWADGNTADGNVPSVTPALLDRITDCAGFGEAMISVGWLEVNGDGIRFVNWDHHNSQSAKQRGLTAKRVAKSRRTAALHERYMSVTPSVTLALPEQSREEKSKEEERQQQQQSAYQHTPPLTAPNHPDTVAAAALSLLKKSGFCSAAAAEIVEASMAALVGNARKQTVLDRALEALQTAEDRKAKNPLGFIRKYMTDMDYFPVQKPKKRNKQERKHGSNG